MTICQVRIEQSELGDQMPDVGWRVVAPLAADAADNDSARPRFSGLERRNLESPQSPQQIAEADLLDRLARDVGQIQIYSARALGVAIAAVLIATLLHSLGGSAPDDFRFGVYVVATLATGLIAGVPAAIGAAAASLLIVTWAYVPPYFAFKVPDTSDQVSLIFAAFASLVTIYFAHCCRTVLRRLHQRELANQILVGELEHRGRNLFVITQVILRKSLADQPRRADEIIGRLRSVQSANELLTGSKARPLTIRGLLSQEFAPYGESRFVARGPEVKVSPATARALLLLFHELVTNAVKYGALSRPGGVVIVEWRWNGDRRVELAWKENGGPSISCPTRQGFGSQLIDACIKDLAGTIQSNFAPTGYSCLIAFRI